MTDAFINQIIRLPTGAASRLHIMWLRALGAKIAPKCRLVSPQVPRNPWDIVLTEGVALDRDVTLLATGRRAAVPRITIGARAYINRHTMLDASLQITVGADTMIGPFCYITDHDHATGLDGPVGQQGLISQPVAIGENVWLGAGVIVLKGVQIGAGAVVGAGSVITRDVPPGARVAGVPARLLAQVSADQRDG